MEIIIVDSGIGIANALSQAIPNINNREYLEECIKFGVTNGNGRGHGLYFISEFIRRNGGIFRLWSGENYLQIIDGHQHVYDSPNWNGVILKFFIKFDIKVTLQDLLDEKYN